MVGFLIITASVAVAAKPNIVYVMTDDQDVELGGMTPLKQVRELLGEQGAVGESFYIATPICCPSRTETLSGRLYHNVLTDNLSGCMHVDQTKYIFEHSSSLFPQMQSAGYLTGGFGKVRSHATRRGRTLLRAASRGPPDTPRQFYHCLSLALAT